MSNDTTIEGLLGDTANDAGINNSVTAMLVDAGTVRTVTKGHGVTPDTFTKTEALIVTGLVDDSGSIFAKRVDDSGSISNEGNDIAVREGVSAIIDALLGTKKKDGILYSCRLLNAGILCPYTFLEQAPRLDNKNFRDGGGTPLYDRAFETLASVMAKVKEFEDAAINTRSWTIIVTDGADGGSRKTARDVAELLKGLNSELHTVLGFGINDGQTDFRRVFREMGIADKNILVSGGDLSAIRATFRLASQSAAAMNQPGVGGLGGFGA